jgi:hypothetical protein
MYREVWVYDIMSMYLSVRLWSVTKFKTTDRFSWHAELISSR